MNDIILNAPQDCQRNPTPPLLYELGVKGARPTPGRHPVRACGRHPVASG
ncbi:hypothetical protein [Streptomyces sp. NPDC057280]